MGNDQGKGDNKDHRHISLIDDQLQKKFRQGVQFNLKVVIRGERQTGKSCLFQRLQGKSFVEAYEPTNAIQTAHISWSPKHSNDTVKVEIWDVVDRAQVSPSSRKPSMSQKEGSHAVAHLDAMTVNVYQGAQLVVFLYDPFRPETYEYVKQEIHRVPDTLQVLVLSNFRDKPGPFAVTPSSVQSFARSLDGTFVFFECSLLNCYGLSALHQYLSLPYWRMKRAMVERQLKEIDSEMKQTESEFLRLSTNQNYDAFLKGLSLTADTVNGMATDSPRHNTISSPVHDHKLTSNSLRINHDTVRKSVPLPSAFQSASTESISRIDSRPNPHRTSNKELQSIDQFYAGDLDEDFFGESTGDSPVRTRKSVSVDAVPPPPPPPPPPATVVNVTATDVTSNVFAKEKVNSSKSVVQPSINYSSMTYEEFLDDEPSQSHTSAPTDNNGYEDLDGSDGSEVKISYRNQNAGAAYQITSPTLEDRKRRDESDNKSSSRRKHRSDRDRDRDRDRDPTGERSRRRRDRDAEKAQDEGTGDEQRRRKKDGDRHRHKHTHTHRDRERDRERDSGDAKHRSTSHSRTIPTPPVHTTAQDSEETVDRVARFDSRSDGYENI